MWSGKKTNYTIVQFRYIIGKNLKRKKSITRAWTLKIVLVARGEDVYQHGKRRNGTSHRVCAVYQIGNQPLQSKSKKSVKNIFPHLPAT